MRAAVEDRMTRPLLISYFNLALDRWIMWLASRPPSATLLAGRRYEGLLRAAV